ncbi:hypothetical protein E3N88_09713 [Mikania micrantha]|uniref:Retrotransposon Copia-like N-terminal domain-containing protein n=1 Tax=Mikania micrantha TaxID=192012 RepID=A0A5N6PKQ5_9ASTR|nr:hypothetical protein E3N88_09713 [Mikania micrantha]
MGRESNYPQLVIVVMQLIKMMVEAQLVQITIVQLTASTHFNISLTTDNFPVWRKHVYSTLIGLDLVHFITGTKQTPAEFLDAEATKPNPEYYPCFRQDQIILAALLGSRSPTIQPMIASAATARDAWERLVTSYANPSRSRVISLKSKLASNPRGTRNITEYLRGMKSIADELALVQHPVNDEDLMVHILCQLGDNYKTVAQSLRILDSKLTFPELFEKLVDFERELHQTTVASPFMATANFTQRHTRNGSSSTPDRRDVQSKFNNRPFRNQWRPDITNELENLECKTIILVGDSSPFNDEALHMTAKLGRNCSALIEELNSIEDCIRMEMRENYREEMGKRRITNFDIIFL